MKKSKPISITILTILAVACVPQLPNQDALTRTVSQVNRTGEKAISAYADPKLAEYGILDVTLSPYNADPTGKIDATTSIQQALKDARDARLITYLPAGRYLVSNTITGIQGTVDWDEWHYDGFADPWVGTASFEYPNVIIGPSSGGRAVIVLADNTVGFNDPGNPKLVIYFWSRMEYGNVDKNKTQPNINFNQKIIDIDFELGKNNPGAIAINHQGAEGSVIEDVHIIADGAFAGIQNAPGSGGAIHGVSVTGGKYGFYFRNKDSGLRASQPSPVVSSVILKNQTESAILYDGRGPLTIVGALIEGSGIISDCPQAANGNGAMNIIDAVIRLKKDEPAISGNHSVVIQNVYIENARVAVKVREQPELAGNQEGWVHIKECVIPGTNKSHPLAGSKIRTDDIWVDGKRVSEIPSIVTNESPSDPDGLVIRHDWPHPFPSRLSQGSVNVKDAPFNAIGDGIADDAGAIQSAIDQHEIVFIPKGIFAISKPLVLNSHTKLIGLGNVQTIITPFKGPNLFNNPDTALPLIETVDDSKAETVLAFMKLLVPVENPCVYALKWRAGRNSIVRNVYPIRGPWHPNGTGMNIPMVRIEDSGGGRWYTNVLLHWWEQGPDYRHLLIKGTREPLSFYMLEPQHSRGTTMVELTNASNVDIFSVKTEGDYSILTMVNSNNIRLFGQAGNGSPFAGYSLFNVVNCSDFMLTNINPFYKALGHYGALGVSHNPALWFMLTESAKGKTDPVKVPGTEQFALYKRGNPKQVN